MSTSDILTVIGILVGVIAIPITFVLGRRTRQIPDLCFARDFDLLISPEDGLLNQGLTVNFADHVVSRVSRTRIAIWNNRGDTVRGTEILDADPLRVQLAPNDVVLQVRPLFHSRSQISFNVALNPDHPDQVPITFDFLDPGDGGIFEVLHQTSEPGRITGTVRGVTLHDRGNTLLSPRSLAGTKIKSRFRRFFYVTHRSQRAAFILGSGLWTALVAGGITFGIMIAFSLPQPPQLVDPTTYPLNTLQGQADFAKQVQRIGLNDLLYELLIVAGIGYPLLIGFVLITYFYHITRRIIPSSIVQEEHIPNAATTSSGKLPAIITNNDVRMTPDHML